MAWHGMAKREGGVCARPYALRMRKSCPECGVTCPEYCLSLLLCFLCPPATALFLRVWSLASRCCCVSSALLRLPCSYVSGVLPLVAPVSPLISCDSLVPYVPAVSSLVAPVSLWLSDGRVAPWHASRSASTTTHCTVHDHAWHGAVQRFYVILQNWI